MRSAERDEAPDTSRPAEIGDGPLALVVAAGLVITTGLIGDLMRHVLNPPVVPDGVLGGWHPVIWVGAAMSVLVTVIGVAGAGARSIPTRLGWLAPAVIGSVVVAAAAPLLHFWHRRVGPETRIEALLSPPHLVVFGGAVLVLVTPASVIARQTRETREPGGAAAVGYVRSGLAWLPMTVVLTMANLLTGYTSALLDGVSFDFGAIEPIVGRSVTDPETIRALASMIWLSATIAIVHGWLLGRFRPRFGTALGGFALVAVTPIVAGGVDGTRAMTAGLLAAGIVLELSLAAAGRRSTNRIAVPTVVAAVVTLWTVVLLVLERRGELSWSFSLATGSIVLNGIVAAMAALAGVAGTIDPERSRPLPSTRSDAGRSKRLPRRSEAEPGADRSSARRPIDRLLAEFDDDELFTPRRNPGGPDDHGAPDESGEVARAKERGRRRSDRQ